MIILDERDGCIKSRVKGREGRIAKVYFPCSAIRSANVHLISLTVTNGMRSLIESIQTDPFLPTHLLPGGLSTTAAPARPETMSIWKMETRAEDVGEVEEGEWGLWRCEAAGEAARKKLKAARESRAED